MSLRIGDIILSINLLFLIAGFAYFLRLSFPRLTALDPARTGHALRTLATASLTGIAGAALYGHWGAAPGDTPALAYATDLAFGSFGGYWGVLLGAIAISLTRRTPRRPLLDALIPGLLAGGAIARLAGLLSGGDPGIAIDALGPFQPFEHWAAYDIAAHLIVLYAVTRPTLRPPGHATAQFLIGYGLLRFGTEFARDAPLLIAGLTYGQVMALIQSAFGLLWIGRIGTLDRSCTEEPFGAECRPNRTSAPALATYRRSAQ